MQVFGFVNLFEIIICAIVKIEYMNLEYYNSDHGLIFYWKSLSKSIKSINQSKQICT